MKRIVFCFVFLFLCLNQSAKAEIPADLAIKAIVGEAEGENFIGKVAIGEAIRNRRTLKGVYGLNSKRLGLASPSVWKDAEKAWLESVGSNLTKGADVWGSKADVRIFKRQAWFKSYEHTVTIGNHLFFRRVK